MARPVAYLAIHTCAYATDPAAADDDDDDDTRPIR